MKTSKTNLKVYEGLADALDRLPIGFPRTKSRVELQILSPETTAFLSSRRLHPSQEFHPRRDGTTVLRMTVRGTVELTSWILSLSPWVRVLQPASLRQEVARRLREASALYMDQSRS